MGRPRITFPLVLLLAGCAPVPHGPYYLPSYPDPSSQVTRASCAGQSGPPVNLRFSPAPGMTLSVNAERAPPDRNLSDRPLRVSITLPPGATFRFLSDEITVDPVPRGVMRAFTGMIVSETQRQAAGSWVDMDADGPVPAQSVLPDAAVPVATLRFLQTTVEGMSASVLEMRLPDILSGQDRRSFAPQRLLATAPVKAGLGSPYRTGEHSAGLKAREAACRRETPGNHCAEMAVIDSRSLAPRSGDFEWAGVVWNRNDPAREAIRHELILNAFTPARWRISEPVVRVLDPAGGTTLESPLSPVSVSWHARVALSTPVRAGASAGEAATTLRLETSLGDREVPRVRVQLPGFLLNGNRHSLHPIDLEMRRLDVGIEPFNC